MRTSAKVGAGIAAAVLVFLGLFAANDPESFKGALRLPIGPFKPNVLTASVNHDVAGAKVTRGTNVVRIGSWKLRVFGENVDLTTLTFSTKAAGAAHMTNLTAKVNGADFGTVAPAFQTLVAASPNGAYTGKHAFTLPANGLLRLNQASHTIDLYADIGSGYQPVPDSFSVSFFANGKSVLPPPNLARPQPVKPLKNFMSNTARGQTTDVFEHGEISADRATDSPFGNIVPGNDMTLAKWNLQAAYENAEVRGFCFTILNSPNQIVTGPAGNIALAGNVQFVLGNGQVVHSMAAANIQWETCVDLSSFFVLQKDATETLSVKANISDSARGTLMARLWRVKGMGQNSGLELESVGDSFGNTLTLPQQAPMPGSLSVTKSNTSPVGTINGPGTTTDVVFAEFLLSASGEDIEVKGAGVDFNSDVSTTTSTSTCATAATCDLSGTVKLIMVDEVGTGTTVLSQAGVTASIWDGDTGDETAFSTTYTVRANSSVLLKVVGNVHTTNAVDGETFVASLESIGFRGVSSGVSGAVFNGAFIDGNVLRLMRNPARFSEWHEYYSPQTTSPGSARQLGIWNFRADTEDLEVRKICFDLGNGVAPSDLNILRVDEYTPGASTAGVTYSTQAADEHVDGECQQYTLHTYFVVPKNTTSQILLLADILPSALGKSLGVRLGVRQVRGMTSGVIRDIPGEGRDPYPYPVRIGN